VRPELRLRHMGMYVWDLEKMASFYQEVLGFVATDRGSVRGHEVVFLSCDPTAHHQLVMETGRPPGRGPGFGLQQISFQVEQLDDLRAMRRLVQTRPDVERLQSVDHGNSWSLYFWDPEDNRIEVYMDTPWHVDQPYVHPLDLDQSDAQIHATTTAHLQGKAGLKPMDQWQSEMARQIAQSAR
jgi:catechol-2,3-dioxygenase